MRYVEVSRPFGAAENTDDVGWRAELKNEEGSPGLCCRFARRLCTRSASADGGTCRLPDDGQSWQPLSEIAETEMEMRALLLAAALCGMRPGVAAAADLSTPHAPSTALEADWSGFSFDVTIYAPLDSRVSYGLWSSATRDLANSTGVQAVGTGSYLFQAPGSNFFFGPRLKIRGGVVETMPLDFTIRDNGAATLGAEGGFAFGSFYLYGFGGGGVAWLPTSQLDFGTANSVVSAIEFGLGVRYAINDRWYAKVEGSHDILGDHRLGAFYFDPKPFEAIAAGFGLRF
jgi:hypothetical protein